MSAGTTKKAAAGGKAKKAKAGIAPPNLVVETFTVEGTAAYMQHKWSEKTKRLLEARHEEGSKQAGKRKAKPPRDFDDECREAQYLGPNGEHGIPAASFRAAMIDACRLVGFKMTLAKQALFVLADTIDPSCGTQLVLFTSGTPQKTVMPVLNETGVADLRARPMWQSEWQAKVRIRYDADIFTSAEVRSLLERAGMQCGIGEGRPFSKRSYGCGLGTFRVL